MSIVSRTVALLCLALLAACTEGEPQTHTTSANVDDAAIPVMLAALDELAGNDLPVDDLLELATSTPMDEETQMRFAFVYNGEDTEMLVHFWREQVDWLHVYASSESKNLITATESTIKTFER